ncbi:uncharacterized protein [Acropora muricata]|uniref:uncharacterized protein n=1 Tax=Acropora muricata TaxID=159855 RepID=UPI0034E60471
MRAIARLISLNFRLSDCYYDLARREKSTEKPNIITKLYDIRVYTSCVRSCSLLFIPTIKRGTSAGKLDSFRHVFILWYVAFGRRSKIFILVVNCSLTAKLIISFSSCWARRLSTEIRMPRLLWFALLFSLITLDQTDGWRRRRRRRCWRVDCAVSWGSWSSCSRSCGGGIRHRYGSITRQPACGGRSCPHLTEYQSCNFYNCPAGDEHSGQQQKKKKGKKDRLTREKVKSN